MRRPLSQIDFSHAPIVVTFWVQSGTKTLHTGIPQRRNLPWPSMAISAARVPTSVGLPLLAISQRLESVRLNAAFGFPGGLLCPCVFPPE